MGYGGYVKITNETEKDFSLKVSTSNKKCMHDTGDWSDLIPFNKTSERQYIEASAAFGGCMTAVSVFVFNFEIINSVTGVVETLPSMSLSEKSNKWSVGFAPDNVTADIDNSGKQAKINITVNRLEE